MTVDLDALEALLAAATPGEWKADYFNGVVASGLTDTYGGAVYSSIVWCEETERTDAEGRTWSTGGSAEANASLIAAAVTALPELLRLARVGQAAVEVEGAGGVLVRANWTVGDDAEAAYDKFRRLLHEEATRAEAGR